jgi:CubicO group peptidase (beta-lactamase class C family)
MKKTIKNSVLVLALSTTLFSCGKGSSISCSAKTEDFSKPMQEAIKYIEDDQLNVYSVAEMSSKGIICKSFEDPIDIHSIYSLSKNFTSMAYGTLVDEGKADPEKTIYSYFSTDYPDMDEKWKEVKVKNVLTQTTGITSGFLDIDQDDIKSFGDDYLKYTLDHVPTETPGTHFQYSDSNYYLISSVIKKITGQNSQELIKEKIFTPLGITNYTFATDTKGNFMGATGLYLTAIDVTKLGYMIMNYGKYDDKQVVSEDYIQTACNKIVNSDGGNTYYGYSIWSRTDIKNIIYGNGMLGQYMIIDFNRGIVSAVVSEDGTGLTDELFEALVRY